MITLPISTNWIDPIIIWKSFHYSYTFLAQLVIKYILHLICLTPLLLVTWPFSTYPSNQFWLMWSATACNQWKMKTIEGNKKKNEQIKIIVHNLFYDFCSYWLVDSLLEMHFDSKLRRDSDNEIKSIKLQMTIMKFWLYVCLYIFALLMHRVCAKEIKWKQTFPTWERWIE